MQKLNLLAALACLAAGLGSASSAQAQAFATFVSGNGSDGNDCLTPATACRQFGGATGAIIKTQADGIIHVLPGDYVGFTITKTLDIIADGATASVTIGAVVPPPGVTGNTAIAVNVAATDVVRIRGFTLYVANHGIAIGGSGGIVHLEECTFVAGQGRNGITYAPSAASELYVSDSRVTREQGVTTGFGIIVKPLGAGSAKVVLDNVRVEDGVSGVTIDGRSTTGVNSATIRNSVVTGSSANGIFVADSGGGSTTAMIEEFAVSHNVAFGVISNGANVTVRMRDSTVTGNAKGLGPGAASQIISEGGNVVDGNAINGAFSSKLVQQ